ncbi:unnamed protein product, partial [Sphacelaria rigidula]
VAFTELLQLSVSTCTLSRVARLRSAPPAAAVAVRVIERRGQRDTVRYGSSASVNSASSYHSKIVGLLSRNRTEWLRPGFRSVNTPHPGDSAHPPAVSSAQYDSAPSTRPSYYLQLDFVVVNRHGSL